MKDDWTDALDDTDWVFLKRFVLCSGSLKELAKEYEVSYPTIRLRLDRFIQKIKVYETYREVSQFERTLRGQYADGLISRESFVELLKVYRKEQEKES